MVVLICNSNMFVPGVLTTVLKNPEIYYIIYTDQYGIEKFLQELSLQNTIILRYPNNYKLALVSKENS